MNQSRLPNDPLDHQNDLHFTGEKTEALKAQEPAIASKVAAVLSNPAESTMFLVTPVNSWGLQVNLSAISFNSS